CLARHRRPTAHQKWRKCDRILSNQQRLERDPPGSPASFDLLRVRSSADRVVGNSGDGAVTLGSQLRAQQPIEHVRGGMPWRKREDPWGKRKTSTTWSPSSRTRAPHAPASAPGTELVRRWHRHQTRRCSLPLARSPLYTTPY